MTKWLYRLESIDPENGLWYNMKSEYVWGIRRIEDCDAKFLPMGYDQRYHKDGRDWYSSCSNAEDLSHWCTLDGVLDLVAHGFEFVRYLATEYVEYPLETTFIKSTSLKREVIPIEDIHLIWGGKSCQ